MSLSDEITTSLKDAIEFERLFPMPTFIMMVGLPGSGKSTIVRDIKEKYPPVEVFSSDEYRQKLCGDENDQTKNELVFTTLYKDLIDAITLRGANVIFDATNISRKDRKRALDKVRHLAIKKIAYFIDTDFRECIDRDASRERSVGPHVIEKFIRRFEFPQKFEGFDDIVIHSQRYKDMNSEFNREKEQFYLEEMKHFDQLNPHHIHTLGEHCAKLATQIKLTSHEARIMHEAGWWHDIGKLYTQKLDDKGVAHYYNHDNIGAYTVACNPDILWNAKKWDDVYEVIFFINYHMRAHNDFKSEKAQKKYRALFGEDRFNKLMEFAECDRKASGTYEGER